MWDLDTIVKMNNKEEILYRGSGDLSIYINEDVENEIGAMERRRELDVVEFIGSINPDVPTSLRDILGSFKNECYVEPDKWVVQQNIVDTSTGPRVSGVVIRAKDNFCSEGYGDIDTSGVFDSANDEYFLSYLYTLVITEAQGSREPSDILSAVQAIVNEYKDGVEALEEDMDEDYDED